MISTRPPPRARPAAALMVSGPDGRRYTIEPASRTHTVGELADALGLLRRAVVLVDGVPVDRRARLDHRDRQRQPADRSLHPRPAAPTGHRQRRWCSGGPPCGHRRRRTGGRRGLRPSRRAPSDRTIGDVLGPSRRSPRRAAPRVLDMPRGRQADETCATRRQGPLLVERLRRDDRRVTSACHRRGRRPASSTAPAALMRARRTRGG